MKSLIISVIILFSFIQNANSADEWNNKEITLASILTTTILIDWGQTRDISKKNKAQCQNITDCKRPYYEKNIILGRNPSLEKIDIYMPLALSTTITIANYLPHGMRKTFLYAISIIELGIIHNNQRIGLKINF